VTGDLAGAKAEAVDPSSTPPPAEGGGRPSLSPAERSAAFATGRAPIDREAALRAGSAPVPRRFILLVIAAFAVLGIGGIVAEKLIGNAGVGALISTPVTTLAGTGGSADTGGSTGLGTTTGGAPSTPTLPDAPAVGAAPSAVIGLTRLTGRRAPAFSLQSQTGASWSLADAKGKVVVLTFFNAECDDICPVLSQELLQADQLLGPRRRARVDFVVVNSDPLETSLTPTPPALTETGLTGAANVTFLDGSLTALSAVWKSYGVTVTLDNTTRVITHNDVLDFIDPAGDLELSASPFANEDTLGVYSLQPSVVHAFAEGVAGATTGLLGGTS
jgi:cytochrome oxidase Cu insertion factor (SCO1/SenC/PrrC family)